MEPRWRGLAANAVHSQGKAGCFGGLAEQRAAQLWGHPLTRLKQGGRKITQEGWKRRRRGDAGEMHDSGGRSREG